MKLKSAGGCPSTGVMLARACVGLVIMFASADMIGVSSSYEAVDAMSVTG